MINDIIMVKQKYNKIFKIKIMDILLLIYPIDLINELLLLDEILQASKEKKGNICQFKYEINIMNYTITLCTAIYYIPVKYEKQKQLMSICEKHFKIKNYRTDTLKIINSLIEDIKKILKIRMEILEINSMQEDYIYKLLGEIHNYALNNL
jgi:hypothetical protein